MFKILILTDGVGYEAVNQQIKCANAGVLGLFVVFGGNSRNLTEEKTLLRQLMKGTIATKMYRMKNVSNINEDNNNKRNEGRNKDKTHKGRPKMNITRPTYLSDYA